MKTSLVIDQGNTTLKLSLFQGDGLLRDVRLAETASIGAKLSEFLDGVLPSFAIYAASGRTDEPVLDAISQTIGYEPLKLTHETPVPISISYRSDSLGHDRMAGAVAACGLFDENTELEFMVVADAGTALTLDLVTADKRFRGGNISAGLGMRLHALHKHTAALPDVSPAGDVPPFGHDTDTAIRSGAILGIAAEIGGAYARALRDYSKGAVVLTGGDHELIQNYIDPGIKLFERPALVAEGLNRILFFNENIHKAI